VGPFFQRQFTREFLECGALFTLGAPEQPQQQMEAHGPELGTFVLAVLRRSAGNELLLRLGERLTRDVHGGCQPVRERNLGEQLQGAARRPESFLPPGDVRQPKVVAPVVWLEADRALCRGDGTGSVAALVSGQPEHGPGLG